MLDALVWAFAATVVLAVVSLILKRPRTIAAWIRKLVRRMQLWLYLQRRGNTQRAIERIAAQLTQRPCDEEGSPDEEYRSDLYRWFTGDPDADIDYRRKLQRDRERLRRGDFQPRR